MQFDAAMATCSVPVSYPFKMKYYHLRLNKAKYMVLSKTHASPAFIGSPLESFQLYILPSAATNGNILI